ncbi:hypothetical protein [Kineobactrum salinum]|uniref:EexN family lipoprotein n=1 Tax=Kineobactrum salinum TaxID=2708301 RepID=A0A6C0U0G2_9GAMM|nr:hypothetical protein [Kineobactrum salinum]QIB65496.1 hypothetical protein G3T16_08860 [Kineobactrum salinum]
MRILATTLLLSGFLSLLSGCAGTANPANQVAAADQEGMRCKTMIKTGTRLGTKVCKTEAQWRQDARDSREATEDIQRTSTHGPAGEGI